MQSGQEKVALLLQYLFRIDSDGKLNKDSMRLLHNSGKYPKSEDNNSEVSQSTHLQHPRHITRERGNDQDALTSRIRERFPGHVMPARSYAPPTKKPSPKKTGQSAAEDLALGDPSEDPLSAPAPDGGAPAAGDADAAAAPAPEAGPADADADAAAEPPAEAPPSPQTPAPPMFYFKFEDEELEPVFRAYADLESSVEREGQAGQFLPLMSATGFQALMRDARLLDNRVGFDEVLAVFKRVVPAAEAPTPVIDPRPPTPLPVKDPYLTDEDYRLLEAEFPGSFFITQDGDVPPEDSGAAPEDGAELAEVKEGKPATPAPPAGAVLEELVPLLERVGALLFPRLEAAEANTVVATHVRQFCQRAPDARDVPDEELPGPPAAAAIVEFAPLFAARHTAAREVFAHYAVLGVAVQHMAAWPVMQKYNRTMVADEFVKFLLNFQVVPALLSKREAQACFDAVMEDLGVSSACFPEFVEALIRCALRIAHTAEKKYRSSHDPTELAAVRRLISKASPATRTYFASLEAQKKAGAKGGSGSPLGSKFRDNGSLGRSQAPWPSLGDSAHNPLNTSQKAALQNARTQAKWLYTSQTQIAVSERAHVQHKQTTPSATQGKLNLAETNYQ